MIIRHYILIFILCGICLIIVSCSDEDTNNTVSEQKITQEIISFTTNHTQAGYLKWSLKAKRAVFVENHKILVTAPSVKIYEDSKPSQNDADETEDNSPKFMKITGDRGKVNDQTKDMKISGNVKGVSEKGTLYTNKLFWKEKEELIYVPGKVRIVRGDSVMLGKNMTANPSLEVVNMEDIDFTLYHKDEEID